MYYIPLLQWAQTIWLQFESGELNLLIATAMAEEGLDVATANCVIRFDPVQTPVSLVQARGRAREVKV